MTWARFRKKPIVIRAIPWERDADAPPIELAGIARWTDEGWVLPTLEGPLRIVPGDWIICGVKGEYYPCKPDIFVMTYEPADAKEMSWPIPEL